VRVAKDESREDLGHRRRGGGLSLTELVKPNLRPESALPPQGWEVGLLDQIPPCRCLDPQVTVLPRGARDCKLIVGGRIRVDQMLVQQVSFSGRVGSSPPPWMGRSTPSGQPSPARGWTPQAAPPPAGTSTGWDRPASDLASPFSRKIHKGESRAQRDVNVNVPCITSYARFLVHCYPCPTMWRRAAGDHWLR
jgi:hypothetical protein